MTVEEVRTRLRHKLVEVLGVEEADLLMDRPPGGWGDLVTNASIAPRFDAIDARFEAMDAKFDGKFAAMDAKFDARFAAIDANFENFRFEVRGEIDRAFREQTWRLMMALFAWTGIVTTAIFAAVKI
jgi:hypothetical protein